MALTDLMAPLSESDPCGADLQWDADMLALDQTMLAAQAEDEAVVDGQQVARDAATFDDVIPPWRKRFARARRICACW